MRLTDHTEPPYSELLRCKDVDGLWLCDNRILMTFWGVTIVIRGKYHRTICPTTFTNTTSFKVLDKLEI